MLRHIAVCLLAFFLSASAIERTWKDCTGLETFDAEIASVANNVVTFKKSDGTTFKMEIDKLSNADITFVRQFIKSAQYGHKLPPDAPLSEIDNQVETINSFIRKLRTQIDAAVSEDTSVRKSAALDAIVQSLDAELKRTRLAFRLPITNVVGDRSYTLTLDPPEGIDGITGYPRTFATKLAPTDAVKITTNHVLVVRGYGRLIQASGPSQLYSTAACLVDVYIASTKQYYGIYLENYTWKAEKETIIKSRPQEAGMSAPIARQPGWLNAPPQGAPPLVNLQPSGQSLPSDPNGSVPNGLVPATAPLAVPPSAQTTPSVNDLFSKLIPPPNQPPPSPPPATTPAPVFPNDQATQPVPETPTTVSKPHPPQNQVAERHTMDLKLPSAVYLHEKLTPAMHDQRVARSREIYGPYYETWRARPNIWVGGFIDSTFWYSMESWTADRQATWLWNYQNVIDSDLLSGRRRSDNAVNDAYWKLKVSKPVIDPYYVDPAFSNDPDLMYRDEFVEAVYNDASPVDNWTMPYSWLTAALIGGIVLVIAWSKHEGYF